MSFSFLLRTKELSLVLAEPVVALIWTLTAQFVLVVGHFPVIAGINVPEALLAVVAHAHFAACGGALVVQHVVVARAPFIAACVGTGVDVAVAGGNGNFGAIGGNGVGRWIG